MPKVLHMMPKHGERPDSVEVPDEIAEKLIVMMEKGSVLVAADIEGRETYFNLGAYRWINVTEKTQGMTYGVRVG